MTAPKKPGRAPKRGVKRAFANAYENAAKKMDPLFSSTGQWLPPKDGFGGKKIAVPINYEETLLRNLLAQVRQQAGTLDRLDAAQTTQAERIKGMLNEILNGLEAGMVEPQTGTVVRKLDRLEAKLDVLVNEKLAAALPTKRKRASK